MAGEAGVVSISDVVRADAAVAVLVKKSFLLIGV